MRRRRARASHIARDHRGSETTHKTRPPTHKHQNFTDRLQPTHTAKRAGPLPQEAGQPRRRFDGSTTYYTARGTTTVASEKQRHDPDHGNSCGGERVVYQQR